MLKGTANAARTSVTWHWFNRDRERQNTTTVRKEKVRALIEVMMSVFRLVEKKTKKKRFQLPHW